MIDSPQAKRKGGLSNRLLISARSGCASRFADAERSAISLSRQEPYHARITSGPCAVRAAQIIDGPTQPLPSQAEALMQSSSQNLNLHRGDRIDVV